MKNGLIYFLIFTISMALHNCSSKEINLDKFPHVRLANDSVEMQVFLPDPENGIYRATRFDWSGIIGSAKYKGHQYFGYWKQTHNPYYHEDVAGPVEGYIKPGLGYKDAKPGEGFIRIGVGVIEKKKEQEYKWNGNYTILDHGKWTIDHGKDWIAFLHEVNYKVYGYQYTKTINLKNNGFTIHHKLKNIGSKGIETDQFNHNFFMIDGHKSGPAFKISFPFVITPENDPKGLLDVKGKDLFFKRELKLDSAMLEITGFSRELSDHKVTVLNQKTGAGATYFVDQPLHRLFFWACNTTLSPENSVWISVMPNEEMEWKADYTLFAE